MAVIFIDSPLVGPISPGPAMTVADATIGVLTNWQAWLTGGIALLPQVPDPAVDWSLLVDALIEDNRNAIPYWSAMGLVNAFIDTAAPAVRYRDHLDAASQRLKSIASELVASTASIAVAKSQGLGYIGSRSDVNLYFGEEVWTRLWDGDGPDFLFANHAGDVTFIEAKGRSSPAVNFAAPLSGTFVKQKVQSLNAYLVLPTYIGQQPVARHVLSRVTKEAGRRVQVQWFNNKPLNSEGQVIAPLVLAVALSNFEQVARSLGVSPFDTASVAGARYLLLRGATNEGEPGEVLLRTAVHELFFRIRKFFETRRVMAPPFKRQEAGEAYLELAHSLLNELEAERLLDVKEEFLRESDDEFARPLRRLPMGYAIGI